MSREATDEKVRDFGRDRGRAVAVPIRQSIDPHHVRRAAADHEEELTMGALVSVPPGEVYGPAEGGVTVFCRRHALRSARTVHAVPAGSTIAEILALVAPDRRGQPFVAYLGEEAIPQAIWERVRPKPGTTLTLHAYLEGKAVKSIALIAVAVVASFVTAGFASGFLGAAFAAGTSGAAALGGGIPLAGTLSIRPLFPPGHALCQR